ncbi:MAG: PadR family transcriptional regulator [Clostridiaceae bacterium]|nr:PadR family transcriptional regulator [Clostridiaceae bacterium]
MIDEMGPLCCGKPHQAQRLTEVSLLIFMTQGISHGYAMLEKLKQLNLGLEDLNTSTLYRTLRKMEANGHIRSEWESGGPGPKRRVYQITEQGTAYLKQWIDVLTVRRARIDSIIEAYNRLLS